MSRRSIVVLALLLALVIWFSNIIEFETESWPTFNRTGRINKNMASLSYSMIGSTSHGLDQQLLSICPNNVSAIGFQLRSDQIRLFCQGDNDVQNEKACDLSVNSHLIGYRLGHNRDDGNNKTVAIQMKCNTNDKIILSSDNSQLIWQLNWTLCPILGQRIVGFIGKLENISFACALSNQGEYFLTSKRERLELENVGLLPNDLGSYIARSVTSGLHYGTMDIIRECPSSSSDDQLAFGFQLFTAYNGTRLREKWDSWPDLTKNELGVQQVRLICQDDSFIQSPQTRFYALRYNNMIVHKCKTPGSYLNGFDCAITQTGISTIRMSCSDGSVLTDMTMKDHSQSKWVLPWQGWQRCAHGYGISGLQAESLSGPRIDNKKGVLYIRFKCKKQTSKSRQETRPRFDRTQFVSNDRWYDIGTWDNVHYCPPGEFAIGFRQTVDINSTIRSDENKKSDETGLNQITLLCEGKTYIQTPRHQPIYGYPLNWNYCPNGTYLTAFRIQMDIYHEYNLKNRYTYIDYSGANNIEMKCDTSVIADPKGLSRGTWQNWTECPSGYGIVGFQAQTSPSLRADRNGYSEHKEYMAGMTNLNVACSPPSIVSYRKQSVHYISSPVASKYGLDALRTIWDSVRECPDDKVANGFQLIMLYTDNDNCTDCQRISQIRLYCQTGLVIQSPSLLPDYPISGWPGPVYTCPNGTYLVGFRVKSTTTGYSRFQMKCSGDDEKMIGQQRNDNWDDKQPTVCNPTSGIAGLQAELLAYTNQTLHYAKTKGYPIRVKYVHTQAMVNAVFKCAHTTPDTHQNVAYIRSESKIDLGNWDIVRTCPNDSLAFGIQLLVDKCNDGICKDRTGLNQIRLVCDQHRLIESMPSKSVPLNGKYEPPGHCSNKRSYLTGFRLRIDNRTDDSAGATDIQMACNDGTTVNNGSTGLDYGEWQKWTYCPNSTRMGISGLQVQYNNNVRDEDHNVNNAMIYVKTMMANVNDDMGITNVNFKCSPKIF